MKRLPWGCAAIDIAHLSALLALQRAEVDQAGVSQLTVALSQRP